MIHKHTDTHLHTQRQTVAITIGKICRADLPKNGENARRKHDIGVAYSE